MKINNSQELKEMIVELEAKQKMQQQELLTQFHVALESLRPMNLIKSSLGKIASPHLVSSVLKTAGSIGIGLLTNKIGGIGLASSGIKTFMGGVVKQSVTSTLLGNVDKIKAYGTAIMHNFLGSKKNRLR